MNHATMIFVIRLAAGVDSPFWETSSPVHVRLIKVPDLNTLPELYRRTNQ